MCLPGLKKERAKQRGLVISIHVKLDNFGKRNNSKLGTQRDSEKCLKRGEKEPL